MLFSLSPECIGKHKALLFKTLATSACVKCQTVSCKMVIWVSKNSICRKGSLDESSWVTSWFSSGPYSQKLPWCSSVVNLSSAFLNRKINLLWVWVLPFNWKPPLLLNSSRRKVYLLAQWSRTKRSVHWWKSRVSWWWKWSIFVSRCCDYHLCQGPGAWPGSGLLSCSYCSLRLRAVFWRLCWLSWGSFPQHCIAPYGFVLPLPVTCSFLPPFPALQVWECRAICWEQREEHPQLRREWKVV